MSSASIRSCAWAMSLNAASLLPAVWTVDRSKQCADIFHLERVDPVLGYRSAYPKRVGPKPAQGPTRNQPWDAVTATHSQACLKQHITEHWFDSWQSSFGMAPSPSPPSSSGQWPAIARASNG